MNDARKVGRVTIPTDLDVVPQTLEIINLKTGTLGGKIYYSQFLKEETSSAAE